MNQRQYSKQEKEAFHSERFKHPHPRVQLKMEVMWLKSQGLKNSQVASLAGVCENTVRKYSREYEEGGLEKLKEIKFYQPKSELENHRQTIRGYFEKNPPLSIKEAVAKIEELTGIKRSETQVRKFLKSLGMQCLKVGYVPGKADVEAQEEYQEKKLKPRLKEAKQGKRAVFFVDAAHFVMRALNAITHEVITVTNDTYITADQVSELLKKLANLGLTIPITLVLDNARYQKCQVVTDLAETLGIELLYLPPYSPNLNLIERLWKLVKKKCLYAKYYENFADFKESISDFLAQPHISHKKEMDSLMTLRFQTFKKTHVMTV
jgi:transposase